MNKFLKDSLQELDDLEIHLDLPDDAIADFFEAQKESLKGWVENTKEHLQSVELGEEGNKLKAKLEHMQVQLALGKAEGRDAFEAQKEKLEHSINDTASQLKKWEDGAEAGIDKFSDDFHQMADAFKDRLELLRLKYTLGKADLKDEFEEKRKDLKDKIQAIKSKAPKEEDGDDKWDEVKEEIGEAYDHLKKAVRGIFS